jgi:hypothetical protein
MTKTKELPAKTEAALKTFLLLAITAENGEVAMRDAMKAGCGQPQLDALVRRGILDSRRPIMDVETDFHYWVA